MISNSKQCCHEHAFICFFLLICLCISVSFFSPKKAHTCYILIDKARLPFKKLSTHASQEIVRMLIFSSPLQNCLFSPFNLCLYDKRDSVCWFTLLIISVVILLFALLLSPDTDTFLTFLIRWKSEVSPNIFYKSKCLHIKG